MNRISILPQRNGSPIRPYPPHFRLIGLSKLSRFSSSPKRQLISTKTISQLANEGELCILPLTNCYIKKYVAFSGCSPISPLNKSRKLIIKNREQEINGWIKPVNFLMNSIPDSKQVNVEQSIRKLRRVSYETNNKNAAGRYRKYFQEACNFQADNGKRLLNKNLRKSINPINEGKRPDFLTANCKKKNNKTLKIIANKLKLVFERRSRDIYKILSNKTSLDQGSFSKNYCEAVRAPRNSRKVIISNRNSTEIKMNESFDDSIRSSLSIKERKLKYAASIFSNTKLAQTLQHLEEDK